LPQCSCQIVNVRNAFHKVFKSFGWMVFDMSASCNINKHATLTSIGCLLVLVGHEDAGWMAEH